MHKRNLFIALAIVLVLFAASACVGAPDPVSTPVTTAEDEPTEEPTTEPTPTPESTEEVEQADSQGVDIMNVSEGTAELSFRTTEEDAEEAMTIGFRRVLAHMVGEGKCGLTYEGESLEAGEYDLTYQQALEAIENGEITEIVTDLPKANGGRHRNVHIDLTKPVPVTLHAIERGEDGVGDLTLENDPFEENGLLQSEIGTGYTTVAFGLDFLDGGQESELVQIRVISLPGNNELAFNCSYVDGFLIALQYIESGRVDQEVNNDLIVEELGFADLLVYNQYEEVDPVVGVEPIE